MRAILEGDGFDLALEGAKVGLRDGVAELPESSCGFTFRCF